MTSSVLLTEIDPAGYAVLTLNRPDSLNALSRELMGALTDAVDSLAADPAVRVLIVTGTGRAFCAGLDLKEMGSSAGMIGQGPGGVGDKDPVAALARFDGPVIGAINGLAVTGGFELALACDVLWAAEEARFADTHVRVGIAPAWGLSQKLPRLVGPYRAREVSFTGRWIAAAEAREWGLVGRVVPQAEMLPAVRGLAVEMLAGLPEMLVHYKKVIANGYAMPFGEALEYEQRCGREFNARLRPEAIENRRGTLFEQNRRIGG